MDLGNIDSPLGDLPVAKLQIIDAANVFASYLTGKYPQVDGSRLNYSLSGSLSAMLLAGADKFVELDENKIPEISEIGEKHMTPSARQSFAFFARQMGDLDYVPTLIYQQNPDRLRKGGGGPSFDEIPAAGRASLIQETGQIKIMCDPVQNYGSLKVARLVSQGNEYYITRPDAIFAYKVLHLLQSYEQKPEKFNNDFEHIAAAVKELYNRDALNSCTREVLNGYENTMRESHLKWQENDVNPVAYQNKVPQMIKRVLADKRISSDIRETLEQLV
jgi:hypothetical protein